MIEIKNKKNCCGCRACVQACPKRCISFLQDKEGFSYPKVDIKECIDCHLCETVCPITSGNVSVEPKKVIGAYNINKDERSHSSSGGMFILLAKKTIEKNGVVFGAVFDKDWNVKHTYTETMEGLWPMLQSKYVQSNIGNSFVNVRSFLKQGRKVLFCGTPCQVLGLKRFLRKDYANLLAVDFLCHGVPSPGVWKKYVERELKPLARSATAGKKSVYHLSIDSVSDISAIEFRDKSYYGWKKYGFVVRQKSPLEGDQNTVLLSDNHYTNPYMRGFLSDIFLRPSCYDCKCKHGKSGSDLTLGDFWCAEQVDKDIDDDKGLSLVLVNHPEKVELDDKDYFQKEFAFETVKKLNGGFVEQHPCNRIQRYVFYRLYKSMKMSQSLRYSCLTRKVINAFQRACKL